MERPIEISLSRGGPAYAILAALRMRLDTRRGATAAALVLAGLAWLPLLILSMAQGVAVGNGVRIPLLEDVSTYARFLVALPLFVLAGPFIDRIVSFVVDSLVSSGIVAPAQRPKLDDATARLERGCGAWLPELILLGFVLFLGWLDVHHGVRSDVSSWMATQSGPGVTAAGLWYTFVSLPLFSFLGLRWIWRDLVWSLFLRRLSKLDLVLVLSHPDCVGGLGVLARVNVGFNMVVIALSASFGANIANRMLYAGESFDGMRVVVIAYVLLMAILFQGPLLVFGPLLRRARVRGLLTFSDLAFRYSRSFEGKWVPATPQERVPVPAAEDPLLGTADIQSLADLGNSFDRVARMRFTLNEPRQLALLVASALLPMIPPLAAVVPLQQILEKLLRLVGR